ncbi:MAG: A/G-specific adenine glycosylase [Thermoanaerobaculia bacterium]
MTTGEVPTARLLAWYERHRRDLPWRGSRDPWSIWVSEIMLQQTRVETVVPFFVRFLDKFPNLESLAAAEESEVLELWSGLGYYRRARQLHSAARRLHRTAAIPRSAAELDELPGVGPYTAAAIASIAFDEVVPVLDGNVERVLARRLGLEADPARAAARRELLAAAAGLLDPRRPGDSNQALMELGATLCTPQAPRCEACPLAAGCRGRESGDPARFPLAAARQRPAAEIAQWAAWIEQDGALLLVRRAAGERRMAGLWELPLVTARGRYAAEAALATRFGGEFRLEPPSLELRHGIAADRFLVRVARGKWQSADCLAEGPEAAFRRPDEARGAALTGLARKILERLAPPPATAEPVRSVRRRRE